MYALDISLTRPEFEVEIVLVAAAALNTYPLATVVCLLCAWSLQAKVQTRLGMMKNSLA